MASLPTVGAGGLSSAPAAAEPSTSSYAALEQFEPTSTVTAEVPAAGSGGAQSGAGAPLDDVPMSESEASDDQAAAPVGLASNGANGAQEDVNMVPVAQDNEGGDDDEYEAKAEEESDESDGVVAPGYAGRSSTHAAVSSSRGGRKGKGKLDLPEDLDADLYGLRRSVKPSRSNPSPQSEADCILPSADRVAHRRLAQR